VVFTTVATLNLIQAYKLTMASSMKNLNCEMFELAIQFDEKHFKKKEFKAERECKDKSHNFFVTHHNSQSSRKNEHAHMALSFDKKASYLRIIILPDRLEEDLDGGSESSKIPLEEGVKEVSRFFEKDGFEASLQAVFRFNKHFEPIIKIRYPLLVDSKLLQNAEITGHEIKFSNDSMDGKFLMTANEEGGITTLFSAKTNVMLSEFNPYDEIKLAVSNVQSLLKRKGK